MAEKYSKDAPFEDPVLRCDGCEKIVLNKALHKKGSCPYCGNHRVRSLMAFKFMEYLKMRFVWRVDPLFLARFKRSEDVRAEA